MNGKNLQAIRKELGWTQFQLAKVIRVTANTVARWEREERAITEPMAMLIETVYAGEKKLRHVKSRKR